jgi:Na+-transporting methylmalonyl-CoA/oxaloacetate decarboxylase gamma subunit
MLELLITLMSILGSYNSQATPEEIMHELKKNNAQEEIWDLTDLEIWDLTDLEIWDLTDLE